MTMATAYCWMTASPASVHRPFPIRCCAGISAMRFYPQKRNCMRTFSNSVLITAPSAERLLCRTPTGRNTARNAAAPSDASRRRTRPGGGAASNIKHRESLDFRGFFEGEAGAGGRFHLHLSKSISNILQRRNFYG